jgi:type IV secretion system protein VirB2
MKSLTKNVANFASMLFLMAFTSLAMGQTVPTTGGGSAATTTTSITNFFTNIGALLTVASISVVTIAVIFAGYQIAFANKRISDVAPILVGGLLIGAAGQIASMLVG